MMLMSVIAARRQQILAYLRHLLLTIAKLDAYVDNTDEICKRHRLLVSQARGRIPPHYFYFLLEVRQGTCPE